MRVDTTGGFSASPLETEAAAVAAEAEGYDALSVPETSHDAFVSLALAARATSRIRLQSAIAVAFARNPMTLAYRANDVQLLSGGRFDLGLGSQVRPHIERRFGMPWSRPAARMEDFVSALRAIFDAWATGDRLHHRGAGNRNPEGTPDRDRPVVDFSFMSKPGSWKYNYTDGFRPVGIEQLERLRDVYASYVKLAGLQVLEEASAS